jgi:hypothetical protein
MRHITEGGKERVVLLVRPLAAQDLCARVAAPLVAASSAQQPEHRRDNPSTNNPSTSQRTTGNRQEPSRLEDVRVPCCCGGRDRGGAVVQQGARRHQGAGRHQGRAGRITYRQDGRITCRQDGQHEREPRVTREEGHAARAALYTRLKRERKAKQAPRRWPARARPPRMRSS